ncbi:MAG: UDP-glucose--hexose-1-phosphate uridylyltransferase [Fusobacteriaceae bacterium]
MKNIYSAIDELLNYGIEQKLIGKYDRIIAQNNILKSLKLDSYLSGEKDSSERKAEIKIHEILDYITLWAIDKEIITESIVDRELLDTEIMGHLVPSQSVVIERFMNRHAISPEKAAKEYYNFSKATNYIRMDRVNRNMHWYSNTEYGNLEITVNLSKPEKDPKDIIRERNMPASSYPKCLLCYENVGYAGRINHPARQNHRVIPVTLTREDWYLQYSPYVYYNEHAILFCGEHRPMKIEKKSFERLFDFVDFLPNYFIGSNADLPIVGGSILSHDHFQGGNHDFPMAKATIETEFRFQNYPDIKCGIVKWPMSVIRINGKDRDELIELADKILNEWRNYNDMDVDVKAYTEDVPHNTVTPIVRMREGKYEMDLVLRNNRTSEEHPMGIFHPHSEVHHIKKENIGLIEVMGLAVLPGRLKDEIRDLAETMKSEKGLEKIENSGDLKKHHHWIAEIMNRYENIPLRSQKEIEEILKHEIGVRFSTVLEHSGVYKRDEKGMEGFKRFMKSIYSV